MDFESQVTQVVDIIKPLLPAYIIPCSKLTFANKKALNEAGRRLQTAIATNFANAWKEAIESLPHQQVQNINCLSTKNRHTRSVKPAQAESSTSTKNLSPLPITNIVDDDLSKQWLEFNDKFTR